MQLKMSLCLRARTRVCVLDRKKNHYNLNIN